MSEFSKKKREEVRAKYKGLCAYCGDKLSSMHIDHITPKRRGLTIWELENMGLKRGSDKIDNLNPSCPACNISKSDFTLEKWREELTLKYDRLLKKSNHFRLLHKHGVVKKSRKDVVFYFERINKNK